MNELAAADVKLRTSLEACNMLHPDIGDEDGGVGWKRRRQRKKENEGYEQEELEEDDENKKSV